MNPLVANDAVRPAVGTTFELSCALHWRELDDQWVVFDETAGHMVALDGFDAAVLTTLELGRASLPNLCTSLADAAGLDCDERLVDEVLGVLDGLRRAGIVQQRRD